MFFSTTRNTRLLSALLSGAAVFAALAALAQGSTQNPLVQPDSHPYVPTVRPKEAVQNPKVTPPQQKKHTRSAVPAADLQLFGYNYFAPARAFVRAEYRRLSKRGLSPLTNSGPNSLASAPGSEQQNAALPASPGSEQQNAASPAKPGAANTQGASGQPAAGQGVFNGAQGAQYPQGYAPPYPGSPYYPGYPPYNPYNQQNRPSVLPPSVSAFSGIITPYQQIAYNVQASVPAGYTLSGGDELTVRFSNPAMNQHELTAQVDAQNNLLLPGYGSLNVSGLTIQAVQNLIRRRLSHFFRNVRVSVNLKELHTISVTVAGEAEAPGSYIVPSVTTAFNLLYAAGGPLKSGSLRNIEVRRGGHTLHLDFYRMIAGAAAPVHTGSYEPDISLQNGDVLYVPHSQEQVAVEGAVRSPAYYELLPGETLQNALNLAGGAKEYGASNTVEVITLDPGRARIIKTAYLNQFATLQTKLYDGDIVRVLALRSTIQNQVTVEGAVMQPGRYALTAGMTIADLLHDAREPLPEAFLGRAALTRWGADGVSRLIPINLAGVLSGNSAANLRLHRWDTLQVYTQKQAQFIGVGYVTLRGSVQKPGAYTYQKGMRVADLLLQAGGLLPDADTVVVEHQHGSGSKRYQILTASQLRSSGSTSDPLLHDNDIVAVYTNSQSRFVPEHRVTIRGYVVAPGQYDRGEGMRLSDLLALAGGFLPNAGTQVEIAHARRFVSDTGQASTPARKIVFNAQHQCPPQENVQLKDGDVVLVDGQGNFENNPRIVTINGEVEHPGPYVVSTTTRLDDLIKMAGGLRPDAFPDGAQFNRDPSLMTSPEQQQLARIANDLSKVYNTSNYERELALSDLDRIRASNTAASSGGSLFGLLGSSTTAVAAPNPAAAILAKDLAQHALVSPARELTDGDLTPTGNIAIKLAGALANPQGQENILLKPGDVLSIPSQPTTVQVIGAVVNSRGVLWQPGAGVDYYITHAGGATPDADMQHIVVIRANGGLSPVRSAGRLRVGDVIFVPTKVLVAKITGGSSKINTFFSALTGSAILFSVAKNLLHF